MCDFKFRNFNLTWGMREQYFISVSLFQRLFYLRCNIASHFAKCCCRKEYKIVCSTLAEEVKIVNDFMTCFTQLGDQKGVRECQFMT